VSGGDALDRHSARHLDLALAPVPTLVAGRGDRMLRTAGACADRVLLWCVPASDLARSAGVVAEGAAGRERPPEIVWAPLVAHDDETRRSMMNAAVYASINTAPVVRAGWGLDAALVAAIRAALVSGGTGAAIDLVPPAALDDLVLADPDPVVVAERGRSIGATSVAVPCYDPRRLPAQVEWAHRVVSAL
jgi:hypothetical protein